ncbi:acyl carrier protein [Desulfobulbus alkaliphilus]|uniref:acyl carrier protein n=1 Tax=Desulfobulbus alkaliphilus TaxID=869814 RepID=UPI001966A47C|nr:phosphopantetheine-binding protein [Desulfobulbus alkaliphilus]MBM9537559.1 acyl carrier protein [Desulfobulbus alkaliphilus]
MNQEQLQTIIFAELKTIAPESDPAELSPDENIREALDIDSYSFLKVLVGLNEQTGVDIPEADYGKLSTLQAMTEYLAARIR